MSNQTNDVSIIDNYKVTSEEKKEMPVTCDVCKVEIIVKIPYSVFNRQENFGTLETFYCKCGRYHRIVKQKNLYGVLHG